MSVRFHMGVFGLAAASVGCALPIERGASEAAIVYGVDGRVEPYEHPSAQLRGVARGASVALFDRGALVEDGDGYILPESFTLGEAEGLCEAERFVEQPTAAWCSGMLVAPDLVLTAGHCVPDPSTCASTTFVFDYVYDAAGELARIDATDVYDCETLVVGSTSGDDDYAVLRLDRDVVGRTPVALAPSGAGQVGDSTALVGYPSGLPLKLDSGGFVVAAEGPDILLASCDSFAGNSGGGVLDASARLYGVLISGEADYVRAGDCRVVVSRAMEDGAERVLRVERPLGAACDALGLEGRACPFELTPLPSPSRHSCAVRPPTGSLGYGLSVWCALLVCLRRRRASEIRSRRGLSKDRA